LRVKLGKFRHFGDPLQQQQQQQQPNNSRRHRRIIFTRVCRVAVVVVVVVRCRVFSTRRSGNLLEKFVG